MLLLRADPYLTVAVPSGVPVRTAGTPESLVSSVALHELDLAGARKPTGL